jgi:YYY domain-containing protein
MTFSMPDRMQEQPKHGRNRQLAALLLLVIVLLGGYFRFMSMNWDDFASLHPDERFLTRNLLPLLGSALEFTPDDEHYPTQAMLVSLNNLAVTSSFDIRADTTQRIGGIRGELGYDMAQWWLADESRVERFDTLETGIQALNAGQISGLLVSNLEAQSAASSGAGVRILDTLDTVFIQRTYCTYRYPETGGVGGYFDARCSNLNPHNANVGMYAYGTLPLFMAYWLSDVVRQLDALNIPFISFQGETLVWRFLSALFDTLTILVVFFTGRRLHNKWVGLIAAVLYACAPLAIAKAHYGTVNSITAFFVALSIWAAVAVQDKGRFLHFTIFGIALGAALAGRINVIPLAGVVVLAAMVNAAPVLDGRVPWDERERLLWRNLLGVFIAGITTILAFRLFNPYAFTGPTFFHIIPNGRWLADASNSSAAVSGNSDIPPNWQWLARPSYLYPLKDMLFWGMGLAMGISAWIGVLWAGYRIVRGKPFALRNILPVVWIVVYFGWIGGLWVMTMRYYLPLYSSLALMAAWLIYELWRLAQYRETDVALTRIVLGLLGAIFAAIPLFAVNAGVAITPTLTASVIIAVVLIVFAVLPGFRQRATVLGIFVVGFTVLWGLMFTNIYRHQVTRIQASRWVWENVPGDFAMQVEGAPEGTPLINIPIGNQLGDSAEHSYNMLNLATRYDIGIPRFSEFVAPATGTITTIHAPHLVDAFDNTEDEVLYVSIGQEVDGFTQLLGEAALSANLHRDNHPLGDSYEITLETPVEVVEGERYTLKAEVLEGSVIGSGAIMLTEGGWDDRITTVMICHLPQGITLADDPRPGLVDYDSCNGLLSNYALLQSFDLPMSYPVDESIKLEAMLDGLSVGDYLAITSNRFYDTESRNPARFPMTTRYYELLFNGQLGYELVETFQESYELGAFSVDDQHLPIYDSPTWLNEFEADEAFHVYDHPTVFIFRKRADYDHNQVQMLLRSVSMLRAEQISGANGEVGEQVIGNVYWTSLEADKTPTQLMQPTDVQQANEQGGTWSERFASDSLLNTNQVVGAIVWWLTITAIGLIMFPILFTAFPRLGDRGYGFAKSVGLLLTGWLAWLLSSLKLPMWSQSGLLTILFLLTGISLYLVYRRREDFADYLRVYRHRLIAIEGIALLLYVLFIGVRLLNPDLWHHPMGGEKPMDFAYFNAVLRTTVFPAYDPWFSGGYINYYYFGYVIVGVPVLLLKIVPAFAYNLIIPTLFSLTGIGVFSVAFNIVDSWKSRHADESEDDHKLAFIQRMGNPWVGGFAALLLCVVLGNLDVPRVLISEGIARLGGYDRPTGLENFLIERYTEQNGMPPDAAMFSELHERAMQGYITDEIAYEIDNVVDLWGSFFKGLGPTFGGQILPIGSNRWYWGPTRVLSETPGVEGNAINEMPYFTFVYGDLHAHMINLPFLLFAMLFIFYEVKFADRDERNAFGMGLALFLGALTIGMMRATNTWDFPSFMLFGVIGLSYAWWRRWTGSLFSRDSVTHLVAYIGGFVAIALAVAVPYTGYYAALYNSVALWNDGKTPLWAYFDIHGLFLFLAVALLLWDTSRWLRAVQIRSLSGQRNWMVAGAAAVGITLLVSLIAAMMGYQVALIALPLILWIGFLFFRPEQSVEMQFVLVLMGFALALTLGVEVIVIAGDIGRQNTVFKFYMQAWIAFSVAAGAAFAWLVQHSDFWNNRQRILFYAPLLLLVAFALMFPLLATRARAVDRFAGDETLLTLNGLDYMHYTEHYLLDFEVPIRFETDWQIIRWLQENVQGTPVIMEGRSLASEYRYNLRISINTGLPTVLGWNWHQRQQRTIPPLDRIVFQRETNVNYFYNTNDVSAVVDLIRAYDIRYIIISDMERAIYPPSALAKFEVMANLGLLSAAFEHGEGVVYEVNADAIAAYALHEYAFFRALGVTEPLPSYAAATEVEPNYTPNPDANVDTVLAMLTDYEAMSFLVASNLPRLQLFAPEAYDRLIKLQEMGVLEARNDGILLRVYDVNREALNRALDKE